MNELDVPIYRALARQEAGATNAALCGAQPISGLTPKMIEALAVEEVTAGGPEKLSPRQSRAASMLATGMTVHEVAITLDLHRGTIFRWRHLPAFRKEQRRLAAEAAGRMAGIARRLIVKATGYVDRLMEEENGREDWAARILRNRNLWELARSDADKADG